MRSKATRSIDPARPQARPAATPHAASQLLAQGYGDMRRLAPFERGDDIAFSLLCRRKHLAIRSEVRRTGHDDESALWRQPGHFRKRQEMVDRVLALQGR